MKNNLPNQLNIKNLIQTKWKEQFNELQLEVIKIGLDEGFDVSSYANPEFTGEQMTEILLGLDKDLDVSIYADPKFSSLQMAKIRTGLEQNLDVSMLILNLIQNKCLKLIKD